MTWLVFVPVLLTIIYAVVATTAFVKYSHLI